jgi:cobalt-zinc-cadmium efflux system outer membrane protein
MSRSRVALLGCVWAVLATAAGAEEPVSLPALLSRARDHAPAVAAARARVDEARAATITAGASQPENPELAAAAGPRWAADGTLTDFSVGLSQYFEPGKQRQARRAAATARVGGMTAEADLTLRQVLGDVARRYYHLNASLALADVLARALDTAIEVERVAARRFALGDVAALDVNVARATRARAEAEVAVASAEVARGYGELAALLDWPDLGRVGITRARPVLREVDEAAAAAGLAERPELAALDARVREAEAEQQQALAARSPGFGVSVDYEREERTPVLMAGLIIRLPVFQRGTGPAAEAAARITTLRAERRAAQAAAVGALTGEVAAYRQHREALRVLQADALPAVEENEQLARRSYEAGQISLADWLLYRRESLDAQRALLEHHLRAALALVDIDSLSGVLR